MSRPQNYFSRNGWERKPDYRGKECQDMNEHDLQMTLEECVRAKRPECKTPDIEYIEFICGNHEICKANQQNYQKKRLALEMAKIRLLKEYYIGKFAQGPASGRWPICKSSNTY